MIKNLGKAIVLSAGVMAAPAAYADPSFGIGLTVVLGGEVGVGAKIFSDDRPGEVAASIGVDYLFQSGKVRPNVGVAYLEDNVFLDLNAGLVSGGVDFGLSVGGLCCSSSPAPVIFGGGGEAPTGGGTTDGPV